MRVRVKVCGITRLENAEAAAAAGVDAIGFMFFAGSPRCIDLTKAADIARSLPPFVARVGVFVNPSESEVREAVQTCGLTAVQFHGEETPEFCARFLPLPVIKAFRIKDAESLAALPAYDMAHAWLLDAYVPGQRGGTGARFNWNLAIEARKLGRPIILAGGLTPDNAAQAIHEVHPEALDVSSGVESAPGIKDPALIHRFMAGVRAMRKVI
ncbi:MAG: phosphoribosylanthranilate isomerase [Verrucomicrobiales bacterium]|nr:phosphoribosylanthranilate isomerase [Verrucomicrobiales bacterium]MCP5528080.1 phosphoribosylanthranilate isomerase [Verrucomicrobiales bacterium]